MQIRQFGGAVAPQPEASLCEAQLPLGTALSSQALRTGAESVGAGDRFAQPRLPILGTQAPTPRPATRRMFTTPR